MSGVLANLILASNRPTETETTRFSVRGGSDHGGTCGRPDPTDAFVPDGAPEYDADDRARRTDDPAEPVGDTP